MTKGVASGLLGSNVQTRTEMVHFHLRLVQACLYCNDQHQKLYNRENKEEWTMYEGGWQTCPNRVYKARAKRKGLSSPRGNALPEQEGLDIRITGLGCIATSLNHIGIFWCRIQAGFFAVLSSFQDDGDC